MKKVFGICDLDKSYVEVLTRYIGRKEGRDFNVVGFSKVEALAEFVAREKFSVLLISVSFIEELSSIPAKEDVVPEDTFILTEDIEPGGFRFPEIYKYQSTEAILRQIEKTLSKKKVKGVGVLKTRSIVGIYSPIGRCGKTTLAINTSRKLSQATSTLLLSFDRHQADEIFEESFALDVSYENSNEHSNERARHLGISDLLYLSATEGLENIKENQNIKNVDGIDVILKAKCSEDICLSETSSIVKLVEELRKCAYQKIVIDIGGDIKNPEAILELCDEVIVPYIEEEKSMKKLRMWEDEIEASYGTLVGRLRKVRIEIDGCNC